jgi:hypothetical protein
MAEHIARRLTAPGPKRMLALDGGGVRGMITIGFLERIEEILRQRHGRRDYVLADYFDMIGGTSVGSILATLLALGWPVAAVRREFCDAADDIFRRSPTRWGILAPRFSNRRLERRIRARLHDERRGDMRLDSDRLRTGLAIVAKRADTGSPWVVYNNPSNKYWDDRYDGKGKRTIGNRHYRVADLVRASTAAPSYFDPHTIEIHEDTKADGAKGVFVDGGVSPYNDPSLLMFMMAGVRGYRLGGTEAVFDEANRPVVRGIPWQLGHDKLLIISVGAGDYRIRTASARGKPALLFAGRALLGMTSDAQAMTLKTMQWLANPNKAWTVNREVDDLRWENLGELLGAPRRFLSYARYNVKLEHDWLVKKLGIKRLSDRRLRSLQKLDDPFNIYDYQFLARRAAAHQVTPDDFPWQFDNHKFG